MVNVNFAEHQKQIENNPTDAQLKGLAKSHFAYGWGKQIYGSWTSEQSIIYSNSYDQAVQAFKEEKSTR